MKCALELRSRRGYSARILGIGYILTKTGGRRRRASSGKVGGSPNDEPPGDGGPDEAAMFIAETVAALAGLARRHRLAVLVRLLEMTQMEAEEHIRLRGKRNLS